MTLSDTARFAAAGVVTEGTVHGLLDASAARTPDAVAVTDQVGSWTYGELARHSHAVADWLRARGVRRHDRVVAQLPSGRELVALFFGVVRAGAVFVPLNPSMRRFHLTSVLANAEPVLAVSTGDNVAHLAASTSVPVHELSAVWSEIAAFGGTPALDAHERSDLAVLIYTSGSTAAPKAVMGPHDRVTFATRAIQAVLEYRPDDVVFCRFPLSWDYGLYKVLLCCLAGCRLVLADEESDLRLLHRMRETGATVVPVVPSLATMIATLAARDTAPPPPVRMVTNTGAALPAPTIAALRAAFPGVRVVRQFGQTECKRVSVMPPTEDDQRPASVGLPLPGTEVLILGRDGAPVPAGEVGEIVVTGPHVMPGYWRLPEVTATTFPVVDGVTRLHTGDYGSVDADGYLYFEGRRDDMFKRKGIRMSTIEIEAAAADVPGVGQAAVLPPTSERDLAIVVTGDVASHLVLRELAQRLEPLKVPSVCRVVDELPLTRHGKNDRTAMARLFEGPARPRAARDARLAARHGSPLYVYDLDELSSARAELVDALPAEFDLYYALKANPHPEVVAELCGRGERPCRAEISSTGELAAVLAAGVNPAGCLYTGPGKTAAELREAIRLGVRVFSTDSVTDVRRVGAAAEELGVEVDCLLRVNSATASATTSIRMTGTPSQFGFDSESLAEALPEVLELAGARVTGLHFFPLSNATDENQLAAEFQHTVELAARLRRDLGLPLRYLDIGGGFAAPYGVPGGRGEYPKLRERLTDILDANLPGWRTGAPRVACESGRFLVGTAGTLVTRVTNVKVSRGRKFVVLDAGINTFGGMSGLGRLLPVAVRPEADRPVERASLVGPLCTPGDILGREVEVPVLASGDVVSVPNAGAYGPTASLLMFLGRPAPAEVVVRGDEVVSVSRLEHSRVYQRTDG